MVFSSLLFLFRFLPAVLLIYYLAPGFGKNMLRNLVLFLFSLVFYAWGEPVYVVLMLFSTLVDYINGGLTGYFVHRGKKKAALVFVVLSAAVNLSLLGVFKYAGFFCGILNRAAGLKLPVQELPLPIGISFYTFQTMSYTIDVYRREAEPEKNIINFGAYVSMFPQLIAGPIVRFRDIAVQLKERRLTWDKVSYGALRFTCGLGKKVLLANNAGLVWTEVTGYAAGDHTMAASWLGLLFYMFQIYFDFSGFEIPENFRHPYVSKSITEFWRRWHISLGTWFREYVYIPLGGNRKGKGRTFFNIFVVWFLTGLWHGASVNFIAWGLYFCLFLIVEKLWLLSFLEKLPGIARHIYALLVVYFGWLLFAWEDIRGHRVFLKAMAGMGKAGLISTQTMYLFVTNAALLVILIIGSTQIPKKAAAWLCGKNAIVAEVLKAGFIAAVCLLSTAYLVNATYNPFLYFRF